MNNRRTLLKNSAAVGAAFTILPAGVYGQSAPSKRVNIAMIGVGRQGTAANLGTFLGMDEVRVVSVCDVDRMRMNFAKRKVDQAYGDTACRTFSDFREALEMPGLDAVMISTTDHWHALIAVAAMKKGLHVCCEKAMTRYFGEGRALADLAKKSGVVFRLDSECRSHAYMQKTANLVLNGYIGNIQRIEVGVPHEGKTGVGNPEPSAPPPELDYEMWLGPAPYKPYCVDRVHQTDPETGKWDGRPGWLRIEDYCSGMICNWGGHLMDMANFVNGTSRTGPISVEGSGAFDHEGLWDTVKSFELTYNYANGVRLDYTIKSPYLRVEGDEGWIHAPWHGKGGLEAHDKSIFRVKYRSSDVMVPKRSDKQDFISAIVNGTDVMIDAEAGHRVNSQCLLGLAAIKSGARLEWDPDAERVTNNKKGEALMKASTYREPWTLKNFI